MEIVIKLILVNSILTFIYMLFGLFQKKNSDRQKTMLLTVFFLLCPIVGISCFFISTLVYWLRPSNSLDITGIYFNEERISYHKKENYLDEIDVTPLEDVLRISSVKDKREKLLESIKSDINANMVTYSAAVLSEDSEVSHYAAAMLSKARDSFERSLNKLAQEYDADRTDDKVNLAYIEAVDQYLCCGINLFYEERKKYLYSYNQLCENLYTHNPEALSEKLYAGMIENYIELGELNKAREWTAIFIAVFPKSENAYLAKLHFYFHTGESKRFFESLSELKASGIPISANTIDLIRFFMSKPILAQRKEE